MAEATMQERPLEELEIFAGEWAMIASFVRDPAGAPRARTSFEWLPGKRFLVQRWEVEHPDAPDGIAIIGLDATGAGYIQHYFDSRGVARTYEMTFSDGVWTLERRVAAPDFSQRFIGTFDQAGGMIAGRWQSSSDGANWKPDFDLTYTRVR